MSFLEETNADAIMEKYNQAAELGQNIPPINSLTNKKIAYNISTGKNDVLLPMEGGGYVVLAEQDKDKTQEIKEYAHILKDMPFDIKDYEAAGYTLEEVEAAGVMPKPQEKTGRTEPLTRGEELLVTRSGGDLAMPPSQETLPVVSQNVANEAIAEFTKALVRGGVVKPTKFLEDNFGIYNPLRLQIINPDTGEFDLDFRILSFDEVMQERDENKGKQFFFDIEELVNENEDASIVAGLAGGFGQFLGAYVGLAKFFKFGQTVMAQSFTKGMAADFLAFEGNEGRLTDVLVGLGVDEKFIPSFLVTDPNDPDYVGRFKTALEGGPLGVATEGLLLGIGKVFRAIKDRDVPAEEVAQITQDGKRSIKQIIVDRLNQPGEMPTVGSMGGNVFAPGNASTVIRSEGGLPILQEKGDENLRLHTNRITAMSDGKPYPGAPKNPRTVIKAPEGSDLPDVVVGNIKPDDWQQRIETAMSPDEINKAATWYKTVFGEFQNQADGDPEDIARLTDAWFAGQQNSSPGQTLNDVLFVYEQIKRGVPKEQLKGKGLPSANKIVIDILTQSEITGGAGQKIADFLDSGYGKNVRAIMGNKPEGGSPFVVDIHTGRDTGLVDKTFINHLNRLGYDVPDNIIVDLGGGGIKGPQYESRALFGQELTQHLNNQNWMGRSDWEPAEIQAIGWMQLSSMYGTPNVGGNIQDAFTTNTRRISMESDPGEGSPFAEKFGNDLRSLSDVQTKEVNDKVTSKAIELVNKELGITLGNNVHGTGGWELDQNLSTVQQAIASKDVAIEAGARLGYLLQQTQVWVNAPKAITQNPKDFMIDIVEANGSSLRESQRLKDLFEQIIEKDPDGLFKGYQPIIRNGQPGIRIIIPYSTISKSAKEAKKQNRKIKVQDMIDKVQSFANTELGEITDNLNFDAEVSIMEADLTILENKWTKDKTGGGYKSYFSGQSGQDATGEGTVSGLLDNDAAELEKFFADSIEEAKRNN
nr:hypothetical protein [uncultured Mediterranean phage uvMED]